MANRGEKLLNFLPKHSRVQLLLRFIKGKVFMKNKKQLLIWKT